MRNVKILLFLVLSSLFLIGCGELAYKHLTHDEAKKNDG